MRVFFGLVLPLAFLGLACGPGEKPTTAFVSNQRIVYGDGLHNENTDLIRWHDKLYMVFRGGETSQVGSPTARLKVWESSDLGDQWKLNAEIFMPERDIRDPKLVVEGDALAIYAITRVPGPHVRDATGLAWTVRVATQDGVHFTSPPERIFDETWGFWRYTRHGDTLYATGYNDGDVKVGFFAKEGDQAWKQVSLIYDSEPDVPSEAELSFFGDTAVSLVRLDNGTSLLDEGHTAICVSNPPYSSWDCGRKFDKRLDGPNWFAHDGRQFVVARKHLDGQRKRTAVYEILGNLADPKGAVELKELAELESRGDTAYVGAVPINDHQTLVSWYSSYLNEDPDWLTGIFAPSNIWLAWLDFSKL
ncbi:MAG: hypothetical protein U1E65_29535 [Myxococcota bacterium]